MGAFVEVPAGTRFGRLTVERDRQRGEAKLVCRCDCGASTNALFGNLRKGHTTSCGCAFRDAITTHGMAGSATRNRTYVAWQNMIARCYGRNPRYVADYSGRGITVCEQWRASFEAFLADMGEAPAGLTLDRIDNDGNYEPGNCRWADRKTQKHNQRKRRRLAACGRGHDVSTPDKYYEDKRGFRHCRECTRQRERERYRARSAAS